MPKTKQHKLIPIPAGRPEKYSQELVRKLVDCFKQGLSIKQACFHVGISRETYYEWLKSQPGFSDIMDIAHEYLNSRSRQMLALLIETGDLQAIKFHLTKRDPDYKDKVVVEAPDQKSELEEHREKIKGFLDEISGITESTTSAEAETITEPIS